MDATEQQAQEIIDSFEEYMSVRGDWEPEYPLHGLVHDEHLPLWLQVGHLIKDIKHWRMPNRKGNLRHHVAVVVQKDGACFVGEAACSDEDQYVKRVGYDLAVKRAMIRCVKYHLSESQWKENMPSFMVDSQLHGRELYFALRGAEASNNGGPLDAEWSDVTHSG